jgi:type II secretion system protein J
MRDLRAAFTLLEMMAVIVLMSLVLGVATNVYLDLSRASYAATTETGAARRAMVLLDRVARDLEGAVLVTKPPETDPMEWGWLFLAESESPDAGADRVKFVRRGRTPRSSDLPESDLEVVAWMLAESDDGTLALRRASWPQLPESLDRSFPDEEQSDLVTAGIESFGIRLLGEAGSWTGRWDSSQLADSGALPIAAETEVAFATDEEGVVDGPYTRKVFLPLRPLDLAAKLAEAEGQQPGEELVVEDEDGDGDIDEDDRAIAVERQQQAGRDGDGDGSESGDAGSAVTLAECMARDPGVNAAVQALIAGDPSAEAAAQSLMSMPVAMVAQQFNLAVPAACQ